MKICAVNSSPRGKNGNTYRILNSMKKGAEECGADFEIINLSEKNIRMCVGCLHCWDKYDDSEITCVLKDDEVGILKQMLDSDLIILASPLYYETISGLMKMFVERMVILHNGGILERNGVYTHDISVAVPPIAAMCSCDLPGRSNFEFVSAYMHRIAFDLKTELVAEIYQSESRLLKWNSDSIQIVVNVQKEIWEAAGRDLAQNKKLSDRTISKLNTPMIRFPFYLETANEIAASTREKARMNIKDGYGGY